MLRNISHLFSDPTHSTLLAQVIELRLLTHASSSDQQLALIESPLQHIAGRPHTNITHRQTHGYHQTFFQYFLILYPN
jgi:hypothetical protein